MFGHHRLVVIVAVLVATVTFVQATSSLVLEEVLEHGPLFDELEDEAWWSGVDVIDTALRSSSWSEMSGHQTSSSLPTPSVIPVPEKEEDFCQFWNSESSESACWMMNRAMAMVDLSGGGSMLVVPRLPPPPPVPPSLTDLVKQLNQLQQQQEAVGEPGGDGECLLCQWATLNGTIDLLPNSELSSENTWVPMLIVVALVSAMLGAVLMITALKCRRLKVLPRGGSCPTLPVGYMVGEGKEGVVHAGTELNGGMETLPKNYTCVRPSDANGTMTSTLARPRLETPTNGPMVCDLSSSTSSSQMVMMMNNNRSKSSRRQPDTTSNSTGWRVKLWRKMTGNSDASDRHQQHPDYCLNPYVSGSSGGMDQAADDISAVYAELNSISGGGGGGSTIHRPSPIYHLNTYSEIHEPDHHHHHHHLLLLHHHHQHMMPPPPTHPHNPSHSTAAATLHLRRLLSDGTYENAGYALDGRGGVILMEHDAVSSSNCSASTPSSAYYSDLSHSDRSGGSLHQGQQPIHWVAGQQQQHQSRPRPRTASESHRGSSHSLPPHQHCCQTQTAAHLREHNHHLHTNHHQHSRSLQEQQMLRARDLMPVALQVIPDNQQVPAGYVATDDQQQTFSRGGGVSSSMRDDSGTCKRPLPPLPSRQQQRPQRRYAYAVDHQGGGSESPPSMLAEDDAGESSPVPGVALSCVPSEYV